jgi:hypothetical protein
MKLNGQQKQALYNALLSAFPTRGSLSQMMIFKMDENLEKVAGGETYSDVVLNLIQWADSQGRLEELIIGARAQNSGNRDLLACALEIGLESPPEEPPDEEQDKEPDSGAPPMLQPAISNSPIDRAVNIESLAMLYRQARQASRSVCRVEAYQSMATGFLVSPDLILTAYFVVQNLIEDAAYVDPSTGEETALQPSNIAVRFDYEVIGEGFIRPGQIYHLAPNWHVASSPVDELDFALLRLHATAGRDTLDLTEGTVERGWLNLAATPQLNPGSTLYLLHHPSGMPLKFSSGSLLGPTDIPTRCAYDVFTESGSSGAPCFTTNWEVLAMHEKRGINRIDAELQAQDIKSGVLISEIVKQPEVRRALKL